MQLLRFEALGVHRLPFQSLLGPSVTVSSVIGPSVTVSSAIGPSVKVSSAICPPVTALHLSSTPVNGYSVLGSRVCVFHTIVSLVVIVTPASNTSYSTTNTLAITLELVT